MRALIVVNIDKSIELLLLLQEVVPRRLGCFTLQSEMHAFMAAILLGMTRCNTLDVDTQSQSPNGQLAHAKKRVR